MNKYYIAYGSNMNTEDMKKRCKTAKVICTMKLSNYRPRLIRMKQLLRNFISHTCCNVGKDKKFYNNERFTKLYLKKLYYYL